MKKLLLIILLFSIVLPIRAQDPLTNFQIKHRKKAGNLAFKQQAPILIYILNGDTLNTQKQSHLSDIDLKLVDNFQVLKGEAATSIFGNQGRNGVIVLNLFDIDKSHLYFKKQRELIENTFESSFQIRAQDGQIFGFQLDTTSGESLIKIIDPKFQELQNFSGFNLIYIFTVGPDIYLFDRKSDLSRFQKSWIKDLEIIKSDDLHGGGIRYTISITLVENSKVKEFLNGLKN